MKDSTKTAMITGGIGLGFQLAGASLGVLVQYWTQKVIMKKEQKEAEKKAASNQPDTVGLRD